MDPEVPGSSPGGGTISSLSWRPINAHARFAARAADALGLSFRCLDEDGYLFAVAESPGGERIFGTGSASPYFLNSAAAMSLARDKGFAAEAFGASGVPHVPGRLFFANDRHAVFRKPGREPADALEAALDFVYPVFCKPVSGSKGDFAEPIADAAGFADYLSRVGARHDAILVQPLIRGVEHRVIVLQGVALCSYEKTPLTVTGDGRAVLAELVAAARRRIGPTTAALAPPSLAEAVDEAGRIWSAREAPPQGVRLMVFGPQNRSAGGDAKEVLTPPPEALARLGVQAARALGLSFAGVDVFDISACGDASALMVIEANASPALQTLEAHARLDLIDRIWTANLKAGLGC